MASYLSLADAQTLLGRVLDIYKDDNNVVDTDHLELVIDEAENMVNTAIGSRYAIPVTDTYSVEYLRSIVVPIVRFKTYVQFAESEELPEAVAVEYREALKMLNALARQHVSLPGTSEKSTGRPAYIKTTTKSDSSTGF